MKNFYYGLIAYNEFDMPIKGHNFIADSHIAIGDLIHVLHRYHDIKENSVIRIVVSTHDGRVSVKDGNYIEDVMTDREKIMDLIAYDNQIERFVIQALIFDMTLEIESKLPPF